MSIFIRTVRSGDEGARAFVQTESWRAAFEGILDKDMLDRCRDVDRAAVMYKSLLDEGNGYLCSRSI